MKIRELEKEFTRRGVVYTQIEKNDELVLYKCHDIDGNFDYYEVFKPKTAKPHPMSTEDYDLIEVYPSDNLFGVYAWCCNTVGAVERCIVAHFNDNGNAGELIDICLKKLLRR